MKNLFFVIVLLISGFVKAQVSDVDGNVYKTVVIGEQTWMAENLKTTRYATGDTIPNVVNKDQWLNLTDGAWSYYKNDIKNDELYGKLYNWYNVVDDRNVCPNGWHVPSDEEWKVLADYVIENGYEGTEGVALKGQSGWNDYDGLSGNGTDNFGFNALPGGNRNINGNFSKIGQNGYWWSTSEHANPLNAWSRYLYNNNSNIMNYEDFKNYGFSIRCLKDL